MFIFALDTDTQDMFAGDSLGIIFEHSYQLKDKKFENKHEL